MTITEEKTKKTDAEMAESLGISRQLWQLYRTHPDRLPSFPMLTALLDLPIWEDVIGYLKGRVSKDALVKMIIELQEGSNGKA